MTVRMKNLLKGGNVKTSRRNFRGRPVKTSLRMEVKFPDANFIRRIVSKENRVLYQVGGAMLRSLRTTLGKPLPRQYTKTGKNSSRWKKEIIQGNRHKYPYRIEGSLRNASNFSVFADAGWVICGPMLLNNRGKDVQSEKPAPQLLQEGGTAVIKVWKIRRRKNRKTGVREVSRKGSYDRERVQYKPLPYKQVYGAYGVRVMRQKLQQVEL